MRMISPGPRSTRTASIDGRVRRDTSTRDWQKRVADPVEEDALAYSFYTLLDDAELREIFGDLSAPASGPD
jgi:hypothetical protein